MVLGIGFNTSNAGVLDKIANPFSRDTDSQAYKQHDYKAGFIIEVLDPTKNYEPIQGYKTQLSGNFMPHIPFTSGGEQKVKKDYYPGNNEANLQVLGARESDVVIKGRFYGKKLPRSTPGTAPEDSIENIIKQLQERIDNIRIQGFPVKISLGGWERYAVLRTTKWDERNKKDINYQLTFDIFSVSKPTRCPVLESSKLVPLEINSQLNEQLVALQNDISDRQIPDSMPASLVDVINDASSVIAAAVSGVLSLMDDIVSTGENIKDTINSTVGIVKNFRAEVHRARIRLASISYSLELQGIPVHDSASTSSIMSYRIYISNDILDLMSSMMKQFLAIEETKPLVRHRVVDGQTLQIIAHIYYGDFGRWKDIYDHNKLTSTVLTAGQVLEIPE